MMSRNMMAKDPTMMIPWWPKTPHDRIWPVWLYFAFAWSAWFYLASILHSAILVGIFAVCAMLTAATLSYWTWLAMQIRKRDD